MAATAKLSNSKHTTASVFITCPFCDRIRPAIDIEPQRFDALNIGLCAAAVVPVARASMVDCIACGVVSRDEVSEFCVRVEEMVTDALPDEQRCAAQTVFGEYVC